MRGGRADPVGGAPAPLLSFEAVTVTRADGLAVRAVLEQVSFELEAGSSAGIYGARRSGKSTLLMLACGLQRAQAGAVRLAGVDLGGLSGRAQAELLRRDVALLRHEDFLAGTGETALDLIATALASRGLTLREARRGAQEALERVEAAGLAQQPAGSLSLSERSRVMLARALARRPRLLLVDEPAPLPSPAERERLIALIGELTRAQGIALLVVSEDLAMLAGLQRLASLSAGELRMPSAAGKVVALRARGSAGGGA